MCAVSFTIPYPPQKQRSAFFKAYSLNSIYGGVHWSSRRRYAEKWHEIVHTELIRQKIKKTILKRPVEVWFWWDDRLDIDNHALMGKMTVDALKGWLIEDDNKKHFVAVHHGYWNEGKIGVEIREK